jgi:hypothetical protein
VKQLRLTHYSDPAGVKGEAYDMKGVVAGRGVEQINVDQAEQQPVCRQSLSVNPATRGQ